MKHKNEIHIHRERHEGKMTARGRGCKALCTVLSITLLAAAWWYAILSVFSPGPGSMRLYAAVAAVSAVLMLLDRRFGGRSAIPVLAGALVCAVSLGVHREWAAYDGFFGLAGELIRETGVGDDALAAILFSVPVLELWTLAVRVRRVRILAVLTAIIPYIAAACAGLFPPFGASWFLLLALGGYLIFSSMAPGMSQTFIIAASLCILAGISALAGQALDQTREKEDGFYQMARGRIHEDLIGGIERTIRTLSGSVAEEEEPSADVVEEGETAEQEQTQSGGDQPVPVSDPDRAVDEVREVREEQGAAFDSSSIQTGSAMDDLKSIGSFVPDGSVSRGVILSERPDGTVYLSERIGVEYTGDSWERAGEDVFLAEESMGGAQRVTVRPEDCLDWPEGLAQLEELCRGWETDSLWSVEQQIDEALGSMAVYDTQPGPTPPDRDFAEYFLFENHRGFCVHFATAAALLYRMCGYPARYAEGYAVPASAFEETADGRYEARIDGSMGHAWCQVYDESSGEWLDMEHTPSAAENGTEHAGSGEGVTFSEQDGTGYSYASAALRVILPTAVSVLLLLAAVYAQAGIRRRRLHREMHIRKGGRGILAVFRSVLKTAKYQSGAKEYGEGVPPEAAVKRLKEEYPEITEEEWDWMYAAVMETMFYHPREDRETVEKMYHLYQKFAESASAKMGRAKRVIWKYIL